MIETNDGNYYIFQADIVGSFDDIVQLIKKKTEGFSYFVEPKFPSENPEKNYQWHMDDPVDFEQYKKYVGFTADGWLTFLLKK